MSMRVRLLGGPALTWKGAPLPAPRAASARALLAYLSLHPGPRPRSEVASALWPDVLDESARGSLRQALLLLRRALGPAAAPALLADARTVGLAASVEVDVAELLAAEAAGDPARVVSLARAGPLLPGEEHEVVRAARDRVREALDAALTTLADEAPTPVQAVGHARARVAHDPLSEAATRDLMRRLDAAGDRAAALRAFAALSERLRLHLRVAPSPATRELAAALRAPAAEPGAPVGGPVAAHAADTAPAFDASPSGRAPAPSGDLLPCPLPLIGRRAELDRLLAAWRAPTGAAVLVTGEAGTGKSRLVAELAELARADGGRVAVGGALALRQAAPLTPWADALAMLCDGLPPPPAELLWPQELVDVAPSLAARLGGRRPAAPAGQAALDRVRLHDAITEAVAFAATTAPEPRSLLVLEDLHWADASSLAVLAHLARRVRRLPVLLVVTARAPGTLPRLVVPDDAVALGSLRSEDALALARVAAPAATGAARLGALVDGAGGNALLLVEAARSGGPRAGLDEIVRPRLAALEPRERDLVDLLAVAGRPLALDELDPLGDRLPERVPGALLQSASDGIGFRHALLRDAVYEQLDALARRRLHRDVAGLLRGQPRRAAEVARHLRLAGRPDDAVEHLIEAARQARDVAAVDEAMAFVREGLDLAPSRPELHLLVGELEAVSGRHTESYAAHDRALQLLPPDAHHRRALVALQRGRLAASALCDVEEARRSLRAALALIDRAGTVGAGVRATVVADLAWAEGVVGSPDAVAALVAEAQAALDVLRRGPQPDPDHLMQARVQLAAARLNALIRQGRFDEVHELADEVTAFAAHSGPAQLGSGLLIEIATAAACAGRLEQALGLCDRYLAVVANVPSQRIEALAARAYVLSRLGRHTEAITVGEAGLAAAQDLGHPPLVDLAGHDLGCLLCAAGAHGRGVALLAEAIARGPRASMPRARLVRAESLVALDRADEATSELRAVVLTPLGPADQPAALVPRLARVQALIARARGDLEGARALLEEAAAGWRGLMRHAADGEAYMANIVDLGRPPVAGLTEPAIELDRVLRELRDLEEVLCLDSPTVS